MLRVEHIRKIYDPGLINEMTIFSDFSLHVENGQFITVVGSNGSGKTSLLNMICGNIPIDSGKIILNEQDITSFSEHKRTQRIGRVFQDPAKGTCPSMTILENMSLADNKGEKFNLLLGVNKKRIPYYRIHLEKLKMGLEDKLDTQVGTLSGGQRQALALLIATKAPLDLLILDEHTAALDPKACETVMELTDKIVKEEKVTTIMVTHNLKYAIDYGNRIVMMHKGNIVLDRAGKERKNADVSDILKIFQDMNLEA